MNKVLAFLLIGSFLINQNLMAAETDVCVTSTPVRAEKSWYIGVLTVHWPHMAGVSLNKRFLDGHFEIGGSIGLSPFGFAAANITFDPEKSSNGSPGPLVLDISARGYLLDSNFTPYLEAGMMFSPTPENLYSDRDWPVHPRIQVGIQYDFDIGFVIGLGAEYTFGFHQEDMNIPLPVVNLGVAF